MQIDKENHRRIKKAKIRKERTGTFCLVIGIVSLLAAITLVAQTAALRVFIIGDSTVCNYAASKYPWAGWGQELALFFNKGSIAVTNNAIGGRSSRSFIQDGHWATTLASLQKGDYLLIQFGHNDRSTVVERYTDTAQYRQYLTQYITESRAKGAIPVLVSPMNMNTWNGTTLREVFTEGASDYHAAMKRVATTQKVPFIDLEQKSAKLFQSLGQKYITSYLFMTLAVGEYPNYPDGYSDGTHFQEMGAIAMAKLVVEGIKELSADAEVGKLAALVAPQYAMTVQANKPGAGLITVSGTYPAGTPITVKVIPNAGETFLQWQDQSAKPLTAEKRYQFTMGTIAGSYVAAYKGGVTGVLNAPAFALHAPSISLSGRGILSLASDEKIRSIRIDDLSGKSILRANADCYRTTLDISSFAHGRYLVVARTGRAASSIRGLITR